MAEGADNELDVLHPEQTLQVGGRTVTVREYSFVEGLRIEAKVRPLVQGLDAMAAEDGPAIDRLYALMAENHELVLELVAQACGQPLDWVRGLGDEDGQSLLMAWWSANARFFLRRLILRRAAEQEQSRARDGAPSSPRSSTTDTDGPTSDATPGAS